jgi:hypothetical protein
MLIFQKSAGPYGDATSDYRVYFTRKTTLGEFIDYLKKHRKNEWGCVTVVEPCIPNRKKFKLLYSCGKLTEDRIPEYLKDMPLPRKIKASGGWSRMDYIIILNKKKD